MRHYLLTRSAYGPDVPLAVNRRRLELLGGITARSIAAQTERRITWLVLIDPRDPLLSERIAALGSGGLPVVTAPAGRLIRDHYFDHPQGPWSASIKWDGPTMTSRIDDDDAYAPWALAEFHRRGDAMAARKGYPRRALCLAQGWRVGVGLANLRLDKVSQFLALYAPPGDRTTVMDINHTGMGRLARVQFIETRPAWVWFRHDLARSTNSSATNRDKDKMQPITAALRAAFPIDWSLLA